MEIQLADQHIYRLDDRLTPEEIHQREESITFEQIDLYYRPWWAFEFHWKMTKMVSRDSLFDIGADTVGLLVPGGSIAVKVARIAIEHGNQRT